MTPLRVIRIFLASSITELKEERNKLGEYLSGADIQNLFLHDNVVIQLVRCEDIYSGSDGKTDPQELLNRRLRECEMSVFLFKTKAGPRTVQEFEVAKNLQKEGKHTMYVYCKNIPSEDRSPELKQIIQRLDEEGPDWDSFESVGDVKAAFIKGLLKYEHGLLVSLGERFEESAGATQFWSQMERIEKSGEGSLKRYAFHKELESRSQKDVHQAIGELVSQVGTIMEDSSKTIADKIFRTHEVYQKADRWADETDYDQKLYSKLLFDYAGFLYDYGLYDEAAAIYLRQITLAEALYGPSHETTATSYNNIGCVYKAQGDYAKALEYSGKALSIKERVLGKDHPSTATDYNNIGGVYYDKGDYAKALEYYGKALSIDEKVLGKDHPSTAIDYNNIGGVYKSQGDYAKALEYYGKALSVHEKVLGKDHPSTATSYNNIGSVYDDKGDYAKALGYYGKALSIDEKVLGKDHPTTAIDYSNIGGVYYSQGDYAKALEYLEKALAIFNSKLGSEHPNTKSVRNNMEAIKASMGEA